MNRSLPLLKTDFHNDITWEKTEAFNLTPTNVHVWKVKVSENFSDLFKNYRSILDSNEFNKAKNFHWELDFKSYLTGRMILRILLGNYLNLHPAKIEFNSLSGKPALISTGEVKYNLSYSDDYVLISLGQCDTGIDIEKINNNLNYKVLLNACFTREEISDIQDDTSNSRENFFLHWTRKEALLKYTGQGVINDLTLIPSLDGFHSIINDNLTILENINLISFRIDEQCVGSLVYPISVSNIHYHDWS